MELRAFLCARCLARTEWRAVSGRVTLDSWTVVHRPFTPGFAPPYGVASVIPAEAPRVRLDTMLDPDDLGHVDGGMSGHLAFVDQPAGWTLHRFSPENEGGQTPSAPFDQDSGPTGR